MIHCSCWRNQILLSEAEGKLGGRGGMGNAVSSERCCCQNQGRHQATNPPEQQRVICLVIYKSKSASRRGSATFQLFGSVDGRHVVEEERGTAEEGKDGLPHVDGQLPGRRERGDTQPTAQSTHVTTLYRD